jgi:hypothetical protein
MSFMSVTLKGFLGGQSTPTFWLAEIVPMF